MKGVCGVWVAAMSLLVTQGARAQEQIEFAGQHWDVAGDAKLERLDGEDALQLRSSRLSLPDAEFGDGTIEFDFRTTGHRSFVGVGFRVAESGRDFEYFYLRPSQTGRFDATQYTPVDHGLSAWQIYAEHNAMAWIPPDTWVHVRMEIEGPSMDVFVGDATEPTMRVAHLLRSPETGGLLLIGNFPQGQELDLYPNAFANLTIRRARSRPQPEVGEPMGNGPPNAVQRWDVSPAFPAPAETITELPSDVMAGEWSSIWTHDAQGRLNIGRSRALMDGDHGTTVLARAVIRSDRDQVKRLNFGFSDRGSVFLNGALVFTGDNTYLSRSGRYLGVMTVNNDALYLPLHRGDNELIFAVSEAFGGWGLVARLGDLDGIQLARATP